MTIERIIDYASKHPVEFIAIITLFVTLLSQILVFVEYFRLKGRWDFFSVDVASRHFRHSGFNPEYLATSLFISAVLLFLLLCDLVRAIICNMGYSVIAIVSISLITFAVSCVIFYFFSRGDIDKGIRTKEELRVFVLEKSLFTTIKYFILLSLFCLTYNLVIEGKALYSIILIVLGGAFEIPYEYCIARIRTSRHRIFDIIEYDKEKYCVLTNNAEQYYVVKIEVVNDNPNDEILKLHLDQKMLICAAGTVVSSKCYKSIERYYMGNLISEKKFFLF